MLHKIDAVIVGGGQAGLAISYYLTREGREHVVLERAPAVAHAWRNQRWDSFTLVTQTSRCGCPTPNMTATILTDSCVWLRWSSNFDNYVERFRLPVHCGVEVFSIENISDRYVVRTGQKNYEAENVVIAIGLYRSPKIPAFSVEIPSSVLQLHSLEYKSPSTLPEGKVRVTHHIPDDLPYVTFSLDVTLTTLVQLYDLPNGTWEILDSWEFEKGPSLYQEKTRSFTKGKFGFLIPNDREMEISNFSYHPSSMTSWVDWTRGATSTLVITRRHRSQAWQRYRRTPILER